MGRTSGVGNLKQILLITHCGCGGAERMTVLYAKLLHKRGYDCRLLIFKCLTDEFSLKPFIPDFLPYDMICCRYRYAPFHIMRHIFRKRPSCIFYSYSLFTPILILCKLFVRRMKVVIRECNMPDKHPWIQTYPAKLFMHYADALIAQTDEMKWEMSASYHVVPEKITVINNPLDTALIQQKIKETYRYPSSGCTHYVAVSRIAPQKDIVTMIRAFAIALKSNPEVRLEIVGNIHWNTAYKNQVDEAICELGVSEYVTFHDFQENPYKYINAADVFLLSSVYEGLPNVMLEAMYLGKPIVATRCIPYISQVVHDGVNGYTVPVSTPSEFAEAMMKARKLRINDKFVDINDTEGEIINLFNALT